MIVSYCNANCLHFPSGYLLQRAFFELFLLFTLCTGGKSSGKKIIISIPDKLYILANNIRILITNIELMKNCLKDFYHVKANHFKL